MQKSCKRGKLLYLFNLNNEIEAAFAGSGSDLQLTGIK
jgi:hypothetical protein